MKEMTVLVLSLEGGCEKEVEGANVGDAEEKLRMLKEVYEDYGNRCLGEGK